MPHRKYGDKRLHYRFLARIYQLTENSKRNPVGPLRLGADNGRILTRFFSKVPKIRDTRWTRIWVIN